MSKSEIKRHISEINNDKIKTIIKYLYFYYIGIMNIAWLLFISSISLQQLFQGLLNITVSYFLSLHTYQEFSLTQSERARLMYMWVMKQQNFERRVGTFCMAVSKMIWSPIKFKSLMTVHKYYIDVWYTLWFSMTKLI